MCMLDWILGKITSLKEQSLEQAVQLSGRVPIPDSAQQTLMWHWRTWFIVEDGTAGLTVGLNDPKSLF